MTTVTQVALKMGRNANLGNVLTDSNGNTLYTYKNDPPTLSTCVGGCALTWLPLTTAKGVTPLADKGITANIGVIPRADNTVQITYNDAPLYRYAEDKKPGDANGNGQSGQWLVVPLPTAESAATASTGAVDWTSKGFAVTLTTQQIAAGTSATITTGPYTIQIPANAFNVTVKVIVLAGDLIAFVPKLPAGQMPMLALALNVYDAKTNQLIDKFNAPVSFTVESQDIFASSIFYDVAPDGTPIPDMAGLFVQQGKLNHPLVSPATGWLITAPTARDAPQ